MNEKKFSELKEGMDIASCLDSSIATSKWYTGVIHRLYWPKIHIKRDDGARGTGIDETWQIRVDGDSRDKFVSFSRNMVKKMRRRLK